MPPLELTLAILKPHVIKNPHSLSSIRKLILTSNFKVVKSKRLTFTEKIANSFYTEHNALIRSGPSDVYILARENAIQEWRTLMGPTKAYRAQYEDPDTIRGQFGLSDTRNATHGSDSSESARKEIKLLYPEFDLEKWYENEEYYFRSNSLIFCCFDFVHKINYN